MTIEKSVKAVEVVALEMETPVVVEPETPVGDVLERMRDAQYGCALVCRGDKLCGIFTERDYLARVVTEDVDPAATTLRDVMMPDPETIQADHLLAHAFHLMTVNDLRYLPLVDEQGRPTGVVSSRDLIDYLAALVMG